MRILTFIPVAALALLINGCATAPETKMQASPRQASDIYTQGQQSLTQGDYAEAAKQFKNLEQHYPSSAYTLQAQMELAYSYFKTGNYTSAIDTSERFIRNYPDNENIDYAYYLRGLASYEKSTAQNAGSPVSTQQQNLSLQTTAQYFSALLRDFPNSKYAHDTEKRMAYVHEQLATHEIMLAKQSLQNKNYAKAMIHARAVTEQYPASSVGGEAENITQMASQMMGTPSENANDNNKTTTTKAGLIAMPAVAVAPTLKLDSDITSDTHHEKSEAAPHHNDIAMTVDTPAESSSSKMMIGNTASNEIRDFRWLNERDGSHYTIQLLSTLKEQPLLNFIKDKQLQNKTAYFKKDINGTIWHTLVYGEYPDAKTARSSINKLPDFLRASQPWIQNISTIQQDIKNFSSKH